jgi:integrase
MPQDRTYLQLRGLTWYARVAVPPSLKEKLGTHLRKSLQTQSITEANRRKMLVVGELKRQIEIARQGASWKDWREELRRAKTADAKIEIAHLIADEAGEMEGAKGYAAAKAFYDRATTLEPTLSELVADFLALSDHSTDSLRKHQRALGDLIAYFKDDDLPPGKLGPRDLLKFTDGLLASSLAPNTKRDRLGSLGKFWDWCERRLHAPRGSNPFRDLSVKGGTVEDSRAFTDAEVSKVFASKFPKAWQRHAFTIILLTGARPIEVLGLKHGEIDLVNQTFRIRTAKTEAGIRTLPFRHPLLVHAFTAVKDTDTALDETRVFPAAGPDEKPAKNYVNWFSRHRVRIALGEGATLYSARKTFITKCLDLGLDVVNVERYVGHKNPRLALSTYSKGRSDTGLIAVAEGLTRWHP